MKTRKIYLDNLRVIACLLVVGVHVSAFTIEEYSIKSVSFFFANAYDCFSIVGVPLFVMISGALLLQETYSFSGKSFFLKKIPHIFIVYFFWLFFYNVINCYIEEYGFSFDSILHNIILETLLGNGIYHLWFLPMIIGIYMLLPIYRSFAKNEKVCRYFLILYFIVSILLPTILKFDFRYKTIVQSLYDRIPFSMVIGYSGYFILGHYLDTFVSKIKGKYLIVVTLIGFIAYQVNYLTCYLMSMRANKLSVILNDPLSVPDFILGISIFILMKEVGNQSTRITRLTKYSLGIYLIHPFWLMLIAQTDLLINHLPAGILIPIMTIGIYLVSLLIVFLVSKIPGLRKILIQ